MVIGRFNEPVSNARRAQSPKSKKFHFKAPLCKKCNNERTQRPDREFDRFHQSALANLQAGAEPADAFLESRYEKGSDAYLDFFRYFAKLLACHMAESEAPRLNHMTRFAIGTVNQNCIWIAVGRDPTYEQMSGLLGPHRYAAHGGLVVYGHKRTLRPTGFHSTLTLGPIRYTYFTRLTWIERLELRLGFQTFNEWCMERVRLAIENPIPLREKVALGLADSDELAGRIDGTEDT